MKVTSHNAVDRCVTTFRSGDFVHPILEISEVIETERHHADKLSDQTFQAARLTDWTRKIQHKRCAVLTTYLIELVRKDLLLLLLSGVSCKGRHIYPDNNAKSNAAKWKP